MHYNELYKANLMHEDNFYDALYIKVLRKVLPKFLMFTKTAFIIYKIQGWGGWNNVKI